MKIGIRNQSPLPAGPRLHLNIKLKWRWHLRVQIAVAGESGIRTRNSNFGFTLIEILVVITIVSVVSIVLVDLLIGHNRLYRTQTAELNVQNSARNALDGIDSYTRQANRALSVYTTYTATPQVLILQLQSINGSNQLIPGTFDYVVFYLNGGNLLRVVFPNASSGRSASTKLLASNVTGLVFTPNHSDYSLVTKINTDLTVQESVGLQTRAITVSSEARLRDY